MTIQLRRLAAPVVGLMLMAPAAGCGGSADDPPEQATVAATQESESTPEPGPPDGAVPARIRGTYAMTGKLDDGLPHAGRWTLVLRARRWTLNGPEGERNAGSITGDARRLAFRDDCADEAGIYRWSLRGRVLLLESEDGDACNGREIKLTWSSDPWRRRP